MAHSLCYTPVTTALSTQSKPGVFVGNFPITRISKVSGVKEIGNLRFQSLEVNVKGKYPSPNTKPGSILCGDCDGNGAKACTQCEGSGVNSQDHFNGQFKAGEICWLCSGKREILCGNCNGAGFIGGFMSTFDD